MVKPSKKGPGRRRVITVSIYVLAWMLVSVLSPIWIVIALLVGLVRRRSFVILRLLIFAWFYFALEIIALVLVAGIFLVHRSGEARDSRLYALQARWATANLSAAQWLLGLDIEVDGAEHAVPGPSILLVRHASILDTLLPCAYVQRPYDFRVRYVLKQELLFDPCLDIVGNALPNYFVDRSGNTAAELDGIRLLAENLGTDGLLMFPEGTRFSQEKREKALQRLERDGSAYLPRARALTRVLPPKPGGVLALLGALPGVDCVFFAHSGLESFAKIKDLLSGEVVGSTVRVQLWRVDAKDIPESDADRIGWLYAQWAKVDAFVGNLPETT